MTERFRPHVLASAVVVALLGALWYAGSWATTGMREADLERLADLEHVRALAPVFEAWNGFAAQPQPLALAVAAVQVACCLAIVWFAWRASRSGWVAGIAGVLVVASPFPEHWLGRPAGFADALTAAALAATFGLLLDDGLAPRSRAALAPAAAFAAVLPSGWAIAPVLIAAAVARGRTLPWVLAGGAAAVVLRLIAGVPPEAALGHVSAFGPHALEALRLLVAGTFAAPAIVFALTRPGLVRGRWLVRGEVAVLAAAAAVVPLSGLLVPSWAALFAAQLGITLAAASIAGRVRLRVDTAWATIAIGAIVTAGVLVRPPHPADDAAQVARERGLVRAAAPSFAIVDRGDPALRDRYSTAHLERLAGRPLDVRYLDAVPATSAVPVFEAATTELIPLEGAIRATEALRRLRERMRFDIAGASGRGIPSSRIPQATPNGLGVVPALPQPAPGGRLDAIVVLAGFSDSFEHVLVRPGDRLAYVVAKALDVGSLARGTVTVEIPGQPAIVVHDDVPPAVGHGSLGWRLRTVALPVRGPTPVTIRFAASSLSANNLGDWIAYGIPAVVRP